MFRYVKSANQVMESTTTTGMSNNDDPNKFLVELDLKECKYMKLYKKYCIRKDNDDKNLFKISTVFQIEQKNERSF